MHRPRRTSFHEPANLSQAKKCANTHANETAISFKNVPNLLCAKWCTTPSSQLVCKQRRKGGSRPTLTSNKISYPEFCSLWHKNSCILNCQLIQVCVWVGWGVLFRLATFGAVVIVITAASGILRSRFQKKPLNKDHIL